jgi:hypothetical protein
MARWRRSDAADRRRLGALLGALAALAGGLLAALGLGRLLRRRPEARGGEATGPDVARDGPERSRRPRWAHETSDVRVGVIALFALGMIVSAIVLHLALWWLFGLYASREAATDPTPVPVALTPQTPPEPRLQVNPQADLARFRATEDATLHSYGWVDRDAGVVRIPIERAIDLLAERGLPTRSQR